MDTVEPDKMYAEARAQASDAAAHTREVLSDWLERIESTIRERPGTALLAALGIGFVVGRLLRRGG